MTIASSRTRHCPRCFRAIEINSPIEPFGVVDGQKRWAHVGCFPASGTGVSASVATQTRSVTTRMMERASRPQSPVDQYGEASGLDKAAVREICVEVTEEHTRTVFNEIRQETAEAISDRLESAIERVQVLVARAVAEQSPVEVHHTYTLPDARRVEFSGEVMHPRFDRILRLALAGKPIFLPGPTGCGKTHTAMQLARALDRPLSMVSCSPGMSESAILGRATPNIATGEEIYRCSEFINRFENGGVFLWDEMDAADPSVLLVVNAALANGVVPVPNRHHAPLAYRHPDFVCIAAANTWGTGADRQYVGRNPLDEATLDRFRIGTVACDYSDAVERHVCPDVRLYRQLRGWREKMREAGVKRIISTRFFKDAYDMSIVGDSIEDITASLFGGWKAEEVIKVLGHALAA